MDDFRIPFDTDVTAEERGKLDAKRGYDILDCPYSDTKGAEGWQKGWRRVTSRRLVSLNM